LDEEKTQTPVKRTTKILTGIKQMSDSRRREILNKIQSRRGEKEHLNMIVIGHVDAGKSTLIGHLLFLCGLVSQKVIQKYDI
jgi:GTPase